MPWTPHANGTSDVTAIRAAPTASRPRPAPGSLRRRWSWRDAGAGEVRRPWVARHVAEAPLVLHPGLDLDAVGGGDAARAGEIDLVADVVVVAPLAVRSGKVT